MGSLGNPDVVIADFLLICCSEDVPEFAGPHESVAHASGSRTEKRGEGGEGEEKD